MVRVLPQILLQHLQKLEPDAQFTGSLPVIQSSTGKRYFAKIGSPEDKDQYIGEAESLKLMYMAAPGLSPRVLAHGDAGGLPYFLSEYKDFGHLNDKAAAILGRRMAEELHMYKSTEGFGFRVPTYCGATRQENGWFETWEDCFSALIGGLLDKLEGRFAELRAKGEEVRMK
jgi:protein-ribulosamine 3-kinase